MCGCRNDHSAYIRNQYFLNLPFSDSKQYPQPTVAMETLAAGGPSYGLTSLFYTVVYYSYPCQVLRQTAVILCCESHKGSCHTIQQIYKPLRLDVTQ